MSGRRRRKTYEDDHLPYPQDFLRPLDPHKLLDRFFVRFDGWPALEVLDKLNAQFGIGGAPPYVAIRPADGERGEMIVIRNSEDDTEKSTGVAAVGLTEAQARLHPTARAELDKYARDKLLRLQARNAPGALRYARVLLWWLGTIKPKSTTPAQDRKRRLTNRRRNVRDPDDAFGVRSSRVKMLIRFFRDRRLATHNYDVGDQFAKRFRDRLP